MLEPRREVDTVGPEVDVAPGREVALLPALVLPLPSLRQPPHRGGREARCVGAEQRRQGLLELPGRNALEVEPRQELLEVPGPPQVGWQDRRGEADRSRAAVAAVADPRAAHLDRADPGLNLPLGGMAVAHQPAPAPLVHKPSMSYEERFDLGLDRLRQHPPSTLAQHAQQRIVRDARSWPRQRNNPILLHGVSFQVTSTITEDTPPPASSPKFEHSSSAPLLPLSS